MFTLLRRHPLGAFWVIAYAVSWAFEIPLAVAQQGWASAAPPFALHYLAAFGPAIAALVVSWATEGMTGITVLLAGLRRWRVGWVGALASMSPLVLFGAAALAGRLADGVWPNLALLGEVDYLPYLGGFGATTLWLLTFGLGEELGWRGYALPRLRSRYGALRASLLLALPWTLWHLPAFFYKDSYVQMGLIAGLPMLLVSLVAASVMLTWIFYTTRNSLLAVIVFHGLFDLLSASSASAYAAPIMSVVVWIEALLIALLLDPTGLVDLRGRRRRPNPVR